jgi:quinohemoprotein ethanol dehydrogenase
MRVRLLVLATALGTCLALTASGMATPSGANGTVAAAKVAVTIPLAPRNPTGWDAPSGADWPVVGGNYLQNRYSSLNQITTGNVATLKEAWHIHLNSGKGTQYRGEATPLVYGGIMYMVTGNDDVFAIDATNGNVLWTYNDGPHPGLTNVCCGWDARGLAIGDGKVFVAELDGKVLALDQATGGLLWSATNGRYQDGYTMTMAPLYYNGEVVVGVSGSEQGARGSETAYDSQTGRRLWRFYNVPTPGDIGSGTWPNTSEWQTGGGTLWNTPSVDPVNKVLTYTTANADPWSSRGPGDDLFTASMVALDPLSGDYKWHFQIVHHDIWDYDCPSPTFMFDTTIGGKAVKGVAEACKTGWLYELNRLNGQPITQIDEKAVPQNGFQNTSPTQPIPVGDAFSEQCPQPTDFPAVASDGKPIILGCIYTPYDDTQFVGTAPGTQGGTVTATSAFSPQTNMAYVCSANTRQGEKAIPNASSLYRNGRSFTGRQGTGTSATFAPSGDLSAFDVTTNRIAWKQHYAPLSVPIPSGSHQGCTGGITATAGGLVFVSLPEETAHGIAAYNAQTGTQLWTATTDAGVEAPPMTYSVNGKQYVAIYAGGSTFSIEATSTGEKFPHGDSLYVFALP